MLSMHEVLASATCSCEAIGLEPVETCACDDTFSDYLSEDCTYDLTFRVSQLDRMIVFGDTS